MVNTALGIAECSALKRCFTWYVVLNHSQLNNVVVTAAKRTSQLQAA